MDYDKKELIREALKARTFAYAPYSQFLVGAALLAKDASVSSGCNIENAAYGPTNCAERTAFFQAISKGKREFCAIAIVGGKNNEMEDTFPCGICRQVMQEFCDPEEFEIIVAKSEEEFQVFTLATLLPHGFTLKKE